MIRFRLHKLIMLSLIALVWENPFARIVIGFCMIMISADGVIHYQDDPEEKQ